MWNNAERKKSDYVPIEVHWSAIPGRDEAWKEETIRNTSSEQFQQEFNVEFLGSTNTLISGPKIKQMFATSKDAISHDGHMDIIEMPVPGNTYVLTADVAEGQGLDYSTFSIIDVTSIPYKQVAKYRNNAISPMLFPTVLYTAGMKYNEAFILVEINSIGLQVADILHYELNYDNLIKIQMKGKQGQQFTGGYTRRIAYGLKTSVQTKKIGCANLKTLIESDKLLVYDEDTIKEFTTFSSSKSSFAAEEGSHDDLAMTMVHFGWLASQKYFKQNINNDIRQVLQKEQLEVMDNDIVPFGIIDNGLNDILDSDMGDKELWVLDRERKFVFDNVDFDTLSNKHRL